MKNTLMKIMGVVLTLAMLSGLLIIAVPVSAANQSWSTVKGPAVTAGTSSNVYSFAADGKTAYLYANYAAATTLATAIAEGEGPTEVAVASTAGFAAKGSIKIDSETVNYTGIGEDGLSFTGVSGWPTKSVTEDGVTSIVPNNAAHEEGAIIAISSDMAGKLHKSTDGGITWSSSNLDTGNVITGKTILGLKVNQASASDLVATDGVSLYRSTNSGRTWGQFNPPGVNDDPAAPDATITAVDVANGENGIAYLAAVTSTSATKGVWLYDSDLLIWVQLGTSGDTTSWDTETDNAIAASFSPNYENVPVIVAVANKGTSLVVKTILISNARTIQFGTTISDCELKSGNTPVTSTDTTIASIAFPSSYSSTSSTSRVFIGIGDTSTDPESFTNLVGVFRVNGNSTTSTSYDLGASFNVSSIAYKGTISSGTLAAAALNDYVIKTTTNVSANSPTWTDSTNSPYGAAVPNMKVAFIPGTTTLVAGAAGLGSGLYTSTEYTSFAAISFVSVSSYANISTGMGGGHMNFEGAVQFQTMADTGTGANLIFKTTDSAATWKLIYNSNFYSFGAIQVFMATPGDKDLQTLWIQQASPNADKYIKTTDGGANWDSYNFPSVMGQISSMSVVDANTFWMGSAAGIRKSTSTAIANIDGKSPMVMINIPGFFIIWSTSGEVYVSKDDGVSFERLGAIGQFNNGGPFSPAVLTFAMGPNPTVYCVDVSSGNIMKWVYGVDSSWSIAMNASDLPGSISGYANIKSISAGAGGVWYIQAQSTNTNGQLWRSVDPLNANPDPNRGFEPITGSYFNGNPVMNIPFMSSIADANGVPTYYTTVVGPTATNKYPSTIMKFTDVLLAGPKLTSPADGSVVGTTITITQGQQGNFAAVDFTWTSVNFTGAKYEFQVAWDAEFTNIVSDEIYTGTTVTALNLLAGKTYYCRVKVASPMMSKWSTAVKFNTMIPSDVNEGLNAEGRISPINGSSGVPLTPAITWGSVNSATSYDFKIATDAAFTNVVESKDGLTTTVFSPSKPLSANTVYFWEVRANAGTNIGKWVVSAFTTAAPTSGGTGGTGGQPQPTPTVIVNMPTQPAQPAPVITVNPPAVTVNPPAVTVVPAAPGTPAYIWIIIAIGAVLVIAVIVLIARTRRV